MVDITVVAAVVLMFEVALLFTEPTLDAVGAIDQRDAKKSSSISCWLTGVFHKPAPTIVAGGETICGSTSQASTGRRSCSSTGLCGAQSLSLLSLRICSSYSLTFRLCSASSAASLLRFLMLHTYCGRPQRMAVTKQ
eukprot:TRINITY_DN38508_c0_g1_i1.p1 TRINITY_DN38508_c0_g1~~TRINITY_DN38508_c0_g1_i1.p1  ORF type:complete len:137 (+),score=8.10 TRINITY_DN38508_c0_g1_i1:108-518(+)